METPTVDVNALISHRFRGFAKRENTTAGLIAALDFGVLHLEFDVRMAACGTPMVYHDEYALDARGQKQFLCDYKASSYATLGGRFKYIPTLEDLLLATKEHKNTQARLLIDIKDYGFEDSIHSLVMLYKMLDRIVYVSWLPDVLYRLHEMASNIPKCFSHWCQGISVEIAAKHKAYRSQDGHIAHTDEQYILGVRTGWAVAKPIVGDMLNILQASGGGICVPENMLTTDLNDYYNSNGLFVSTYAYTKWRDVNAHNDKFNIDYYFIDNKQIFDKLL